MEQLKGFNLDKTPETSAELPEKKIAKGIENPNNIEDIIDNPEILIQIREKEIANQIGDLASKARYDFVSIEQSSNLSPAFIQKARKEVGVTEKLKDLRERSRKLFENFKRTIETMLSLEKLPIKPGEVFDSEKEIHNILNQPSLIEQKKAYQEYSEKLIYQQQGLMRMQTDLIMRIRTDPDIDKDKLLEIFDQWSEKYGFTPQQRKATELILNEYEEKHKAVKEIRNKFPKNKYLFTELFGGPPAKKIEVIEGPVSLYFKCYNPSDFVTAYYGYGMEYEFERNGGVIDYYRVAKQTRGACVSGRTINPEYVSSLAGCILIENSSEAPFAFSKDIYSHEEQHAIKRLFNNLFTVNKLDWATKAEKINSLKEASKEGKTKKDIQSLTESYFREARIDMEEDIKDEIMAYMTDKNAAPAGIFTILTEPAESGGLYDIINLKQEYLSDELGNPRSLKQYMMNGALEIINQQNNSEYIKLVENVAQTIFDTEWKQLILDGITAFQFLLNIGYSREQTIALLMQEPLSQWKIKSKRLVENKKK